MVILGLDPGISCTGFGAIYSEGGDPAFLEGGSIKTCSKEGIPKRLHDLYEGIYAVLNQIKPDLVAIEDVFSSIRYPKAGILLGSVIGIIMLASYRHNVPMVEVPTREIKNSLTGYGNANKIQVREVVKKLLHLEKVTSFHAADALATALVVHYRKHVGFKK